MSDTSPFGFGRFVPGFDFLQNLAKGATAGMPGMAMPPGWIAPTMSVEDIDKRIQELKSVQFWLDQNSRALTATVQALEVQKMTLATLKGMNMAMGDLAGAFGASAAPAAPRPAAAPAPAAKQEPQPQPAADDAQAAPPRAASALPGMADPMQWWGALTSQFQQIAANAMKDVSAHQAAFEATREMASDAVKTATGMASQVAAQAAAQGMQTAQGLQNAAAAAIKPRPAATRAAAKPAAKADGASAAPADAAPAASPAPARKASAKTAAPARTRRPAAG